MTKVRTHITISDREDKLVHEYMDKYNCRYSQAVSQLIEIGSSNYLMEKTIDKNNALLDKIYSKTCYSTSLLEQIYSDFGFDELSNKNDNKALNKFKAKFNKYNYDD